MNTLRKFFFVLPLLCALCLGLGMSSSAQAQYAGRVNNYVLGTPKGSFSTIVGLKGTNALFVPGCCSYYYGYNNYQTFSLPFAFNYDSVQYGAGSTMYAYWDGTLGFGSGNPAGSYGYGNGAGNSNYPNRIYVWGGTYLCGFCTNYYDGNGYSSGLYYNVTGSVGSRVMTVEWHGYSIYVYYGYYYSYVNNIQVKIYEANNNIETYYDNQGAYQEGYIPTIGLNGGTSPSFQSKTVIKGTDYNYIGTNVPTSNYLFACPLRKFNVQLSSTPKILSFPGTNVGTPVTANITVKHAGVEGTLDISSVSILGNPDFTVVSYPGSGIINPGGTGTIVVRFTPTTEGTRSALLTIVSNGLDSGTQSINLVGNGLAPLIAVDTNVLFKKDRIKMGKSLTRMIGIKNIGSSGLVWSSFPITGADASQYAVTRFPSTNPIPVNTWDSIGITYTPTVEGRLGAKLDILTNALNQPDVPVQLLGTGILPHIVVTPPNVQFDSVGQGDNLCKTIRVYNPGSDTLFIKNNLMTSGEGDFIVTRLVGTDTIIPPDKFKDISVCFAPRQSGLRTARFVLQTNIINTFEQPRRDTASTITIEFNGTGVPYGVFAQSGAGSTNDSSLVGNQVCSSDSIRNIGDADILIKNWVITGTDKADFTVSGITLPYTLKARSTVLVNICGTPSAQGLRNASLTINGVSNGRNLVLTSPLKVFGINVCATPAPGALFTDQKVLSNTDSTMCVTVTNCGNVPAVYTATLPSGSDYTLVAPTTSTEVAPGATTTFCVKFHPTTMGTSTGNMVISSPDLANINVPLTGVGACAVVTAPAASIPPTNAGGHTPFTVTINNGGNYDWTPGTPVVTPNDGVFTIGALANVPAGGNIQPTLTFNPTAINTLYTAKITFPNATPACAAAMEIDLSQMTGAAGVRQITEQNGFVLGQNYPNPFGAATSFNYTVPNETVINLTISDVTGKVIKTITTGRISAGVHNVTLDASEMASGTYVISLTSGDVTLTRQIVVAK